MIHAARSFDRSGQPTLDDLLADIRALEIVTDGWTDEDRNTLDAITRAHDALHREALARIITAVKSEPHALDRLKQALGDEVVYAVLRRHQLVKPSLNERIDAALASVRPYLESHGGDVELVSIAPPDKVEIRMVGACDGCPASALTLREGIEKAIREHCPEITAISRVAGSLSARPGNSQSVEFISPFARPADQGWLPVCGLDDIPPGRILKTRVAGSEVILSRFDDRVTCFDNACAHLGMALDDGDIDAGILTCPFHGFRYALDSGECLTVPEVQLHAHAVRVIGDSVEVKLS